MPEQLRDHDVNGNACRDAGSIPPALTGRDRVAAMVRHMLLGRKIDGVAFVNALLDLAYDVGEIQCKFGGDETLRFSISSQPPSFDIQVDRARAKLRMMCARLSVLCNESGDQDVSVYGGEGIIKEESTLKQAMDPVLPNSGGATRILTAEPAARPQIREWTTEFTNTPGKQEFLIAPIKR